jgi:hypothetical protein
MQIVKGTGKSESISLKNANGKKIDIISFIHPNGKKVFCAYKEEVEKAVNKVKGGKVLALPRVFIKKDLEFYASIRSYNEETFFCTTTTYMPIFFIKKEDIMKEEFTVDFLLDEE